MGKQGSSSIRQEGLEREFATRREGIAMKRSIVFVLICLYPMKPAWAQPVIDGALDATAYGAALSVQNTDTQFGNASQDDLLVASGSEIDQVFGTVADGRLNVLIAGNLETNFNKLVVFIDSVAGGKNQLVGAELPTGFDAFCGRCGGGFPPPRGDAPEGVGGLQNMTGLKFDDGFEADYALAFTHGNESVDDSTSPTNFYAMSAHFADLTQGAAGEVVAAGIILAPQGMPNVLRLAGEGLSDFPFYPDPLVDPTSTVIGPALPNLGPAELIDRDYALSDGGCLDDSGAGCIARELEFVLDVDPAETGLADPALNNGSDHRNFRNTVDLRLAVDNSNIEGVDGFIAEFPETLGNPQDVTTGIEFSIPLAEIGTPSGPIKIVAFVNGTDYDYASNQFSGDGLLLGNLGSDGSGTFIANTLSVELPLIAGNQYVTVSASPGVDGDYNSNGIVDAADYTVWRDNLGGASLPNEGGISPGIVDTADYEFWKSRYGAASGSGSFQGEGVPEPNTLLLAIILVTGASFGLRRR